MTIIKPASKLKIFYTIIASFVLLLAVGIYVYEYNAEVALRHQIKSLEEGIVEFESRDSALKNELYALLDPKNLENLTAKRGLVFEKNPSYLNLRTDFKDLTRR